VQKGTIPIKNLIAETTPELVNINSSLKDFPTEIQTDIQTLADIYSIAPDHWGFDPINNEIDLLAQNIQNTSTYKDLSGKKIGNFTIHIFNDTELHTTASEVNAYLNDLRKNPDYQISPFEMVYSHEGPYVVLWCFKLTPENKKLDNKVIKGWRIRVYVCCAIPSSTGNSSKSVSPS